MSKVLKGLIVSNELKACPFCGGEVTESRGENISTIECPKCDYELLLYTSKILDTWNSRPTEPKEQIAEDVDEARTLLLNGKCLKGWGGITVRLHQDGDTLLSWNHKKKIWMDTRLMDVYFPPFSLASMNENWEWTVIDNPAICDEVKK